MIYQEYVLSQTPQLYLPWSETSGDTFTDLSGNGHDATPASGIVIPSGVSGAIRGQRAATWTSSFTDFANVPTIPCRGAFTWLLWVRFPLTGFNWYRLATYGGSLFLATHILLSIINNTLSLPHSWQLTVVGPGGDGFLAYQLSDTFLTCWHQFALTWDGTNAMIYGDGVQLVPTSYAPPSPSVWNTPNIPDTLSVSRFDGEMSVNHLAMYDRALSAGDIATDYAAAVPRNRCRPDILRLTYAPGGHTHKWSIPADTTVRITYSDE